MLTLDTSAVLALLNSSRIEYARTKRALETSRGPYLLPFGIFAEVTYLIESRWHASVLDNFLADVQSGFYTLDCGENDLPRIRQLVQRYANLPLSGADASVIACAERNGGKVLTLDRRDFDVVAGEGRITVLPD